MLGHWTMQRSSGKQKVSKTPPLSMLTSPFPASGTHVLVDKLWSWHETWIHARPGDRGIQCAETPRALLHSLRTCMEPRSCAVPVSR